MFKITLTCEYGGKKFSQQYNTDATNFSDDLECVSESFKTKILIELAKSNNKKGFSDFSGGKIDIDIFKKQHDISKS